MYFVCVFVCARASQRASAFKRVCGEGWPVCLILDSIMWGSLLPCMAPFHMCVKKKNPLYFLTVIPTPHPLSLCSLQVVVCPVRPYAQSCVSHAIKLTRVPSYAVRWRGQSSSPRPPLWCVFVFCFFFLFFFPLPSSDARLHDHLLPKADCLRWLFGSLKLRALMDRNFIFPPLLFLPPPPFCQWISFCTVRFKEK